MTWLVYFSLCVILNFLIQVGSGALVGMSKELKQAQHKGYFCMFIVVNFSNAKPFYDNKFYLFKILSVDETIVD